MEFGVGIAVGAVLCYLFTRGGRRNEAKPSILVSEPPLNNNKDKAVVKPARGQYKMVLVVRTDLKMGTGKVCHTTCRAFFVVVCFSFWGHCLGGSAVWARYFGGL